MGTGQAKHMFSLSFEVRDYECDMEGIVNNAVYQNYLEHARHSFLRSEGINFAELTRSGVHPVVVRAELDYLRPLQSGDAFSVGINVVRVSRLKFAFLQDIHRKPDGEHILRARIIAAFVSDAGRPLRPEDAGAGIAKLINSL